MWQSAQKDTNEDLLDLSNKWQLVWVVKWRIELPVVSNKAWVKWTISLKIIISVKS